MVDSRATIFKLVFPAHAGMSLTIKDEDAIARSFPRTRGDEPAGCLSVDDIYKFSPHTRG